MNNNKIRTISHEEFKKRLFTSERGVQVAYTKLHIESLIDELLETRTREIIWYIFNAYSPSALETINTETGERTYVPLQSKEGAILEHFGIEKKSDQDSDVQPNKKLVRYLNDQGFPSLSGLLDDPKAQ